MGDAPKKLAIELIQVSKTYEVPAPPPPRRRGLGAMLKGVRRLLKPETVQRVVVDRLSLQARAGELLALLGGSGSGKPTTLKMINRLIEPDHDGRGRIFIDGQDI